MVILLKHKAYLFSENCQKQSDRRDFTYETEDKNVKIIWQKEELEVVQLKGRDNMFEIGDFVVKANNGICKVEDIGRLDLSTANKDRMYFFLNPIGEANSRLYVPVDKENAGLRKVVTEEEAWKIIEQIPEVEEAWIADDKQREQKYKEAIHSCDLEKLISIIKNMYHRKERRTA